MIHDALAALDFAALCGVTALAHGVAGERLPALDWVARLLVENQALKMGVPTVLAMCVWLHPERGCRAVPLLHSSVFSFMKSHTSPKCLHPGPIRK